MNNKELQKLINQTKPGKVGRPRKQTVKLPPQFRQRLKETYGSMFKAAQETGVSYSMIRKWVSKDEFAIEYADDINLLLTYKF